MLPENVVSITRMRELELQLAECKQQLAHAISSLQAEQSSRLKAEQERERLITRREQTEEALRQSEHRYRSLFSQMSEGFALHEILYDDEGVPCDYLFLEINPAFEHLTGLTREQVLGKTVREVFPETDGDWIVLYGDVATTGKPTHFERYIASLDRYFEVFTYSPASGQFAAILLDCTVRRRAEQSLRESQNRLRLAIDSTESGTFDYELQSGRVVCSDFAKRHLGLHSDAQVTLGTFFERLHPEDHAGVEQVIAHGFDPEKNGHFAAEFRTIEPQSGKIRWISAQGRVLVDSDGNPFRCIGVTLDISQRKQMEQERKELFAELEHQRGLLSAILNQVAAGVVVVEAPSGRVLLVNPGMDHIAGQIDYEQGLDYYKQFKATRPNGQAYGEGEWPLVRSLLRGETVTDEEVEICHSDSSHRFLLVSSTAVRNPGGSIVAAVSISLDITERKRTEAALRSSEERFRLASEAASEAIWEWDVQANNLRCNNAFENLLGKPPGDSAQEWWSQRVHPEDRQRVTSSIWAAINGPNPFWDEEYRVLTRAGTWAEVCDRACIIRAESGKALRLVGAMLDVTLQNKAQRRLHLLAEISGDLLRSENPKDVIAPLCRKVLATIDCQVYFSFLAHEEAKQLRLHSFAGIPEPEAVKFEVLDYGVFVSGSVAKDRHKIVVQELSSEIDPRTAVIRSHGIQAYACYPLITGNRLLGTLSFGTRTRLRFGEDELAVLEAFADEVASAMERHRARRALEEANDLLERKVAERTKEWEQANHCLQVEVAERRRAEQETQARERRYRSLVSASAQIVWSATADGCITEDAPAWRALTGQTLEQMRDHGWISAIHPEDRQRVLASRALCLNDSCETSVEFRVRSVSGEFRLMSARAVPVFGPGKTIDEWIGTCTDITEIRSAEQRRDFINTLLEHFARSTSCQEYLNAVIPVIQEWIGAEAVGIRVLDDSHKLRLESSSGFSADFLQSEPTVCLQNCHCLCLRAMDQRYKPEGDAIITSRGSVTCPDLSQSIRNHAEPLPCSKHFATLTVVPLCCRDQFLGQVFLLDRHPNKFLPARIESIEAISPLIAEAILRFRRETELSRTNQMLRGLASELTLAEERERRRLAKVLHDGMQQMLVSARLHLHVLRPLSKPRQFQLALKRVDDILEDCFKASRTLTAELSPRILYEAGLPAAMEWVGRYFAEKHKLKVNVKAAPDAAVSSEETRVALFQAVRELLFNAVKHAKVKSVSLTLEKAEQNHVRIVISDRGVGFDPAQIRAKGGSTGGFGLFSLRERLQLIGGKLEIRSAPGEGSRFTILAPVGDDFGTAATASTFNRDGLKVAEPPSRPAVKHGKKNLIRVLLADDHETVLEGLLRLIQEQADMVVVGMASDGKEVLRLAAKIHPDVIVMDINMPALDGMEATRQLSAALPKTRIIGLTMHAEPVHILGMREAGAVACLNKADSSAKLIAAIRSAVHRKSQRSSHSAKRK